MSEANRPVCRFAVMSLIGVTVMTVLITIIPVGGFLSHTLETRFAKPDLDHTEFAGVITLSGTIDPASYLDRGDVQFEAPQTGCLRCCALPIAILTNR